MPPALAALGHGACCMRAMGTEVRWLVLPFSPSTVMLIRRLLGGGAGVAALQVIAGDTIVAPQAVSGLFW